MSTTTPPLTEPELAGIEQCCTSGAWPEHDWQAILHNGAEWAVCWQCRREFPADHHSALVRLNLVPRCRRDAEPLDAPSALRLVAEVRRLRAALATIRREEGRVCLSHTHSGHIGCRSSIAAWEIADAALGGERSEG